VGLKVIEAKDEKRGKKVSKRQLASDLPEWNGEL
jgi:hypothetical protein